MLVQKMLESRSFAPVHALLPTDRLAGSWMRRRFRHYRPSISFCEDHRRYRLRTAQTGADLEQVLRLRHQVYYNELLGRCRPLEIDLDRFDMICDHLMIEDRESGRLLGTYRLNCSRFNQSFYSRTEFHLRNILQLPGHKLELGRACLLPDARNSMSIAVLWKGINRYMQMAGCRWLFGCSSIKTTELEEIASLYLYLKDRYLAPAELRVRPRRRFRISGLDSYAEFVRAFSPDFLQDAPAMVPSLLKFYLKAGAMIGGEPALDREFRCVDFFTLLDMRTIDKSLQRKYQ